MNGFNVFIGEMNYSFSHSIDSLYSCYTNGYLFITKFLKQVICTIYSSCSKNFFPKVLLLLLMILITIIPFSLLFFYLILFICYAFFYFVCFILTATNATLKRVELRAMGPLLQVCKFKTYLQTYIKTKFRQTS